MTLRRLASLTALSSAVLLGTGDRSHASFNLSTLFDNVTVTGTALPTTITTEASGTTAGGITFTNGGVLITVGGTTIGLLNEGRTGFVVPGTDSINVGDIVVRTTTAPPPSDTFNINYRDSLTLTNVPPPGTAATSMPLPFTGTLAFNMINTGQGTITNAFTSPTSGSVAVDGVLFTGGVTTFASPTINGSGGSLGGIVTAVVPEPSSVALTSMGVVACGLYFRRGPKARHVA